MTQRERARTERVLARRLEDLDRWTAPVSYREWGWAWALDRIQERIEKVERCRAEIEDLCRKLGYPPHVRATLAHVAAGLGGLATGPSGADGGHTAERREVVKL